MTGKTHHQELADYLKCVIYDLYVLASAVNELKKEDDFVLIEVHKTAALLKLRAIHDFFFRPEVHDSIKLAEFDCFNPVKPKDNPFEKTEWLVLQSIHTFVVHLDKERITKVFKQDDKYSGHKKGDDLPQPKFEEGKEDVIKASVLLMKDAYVFVNSVISHKDFPGLDYCGGKYWRGFAMKLDELT